MPPTSNPSPPRWWRRSSPGKDPTLSSRPSAARPPSTWPCDCTAPGVLDRYGVELIGAGIDAIERAEDRGRFKQVMEEVGLEVPRAGYARSMVEAIRTAEEIGFPVMVRPSFILGGGGTGIAHDPESFIEVARKGLDTSPVGEILVEESVYGWKEFELEVMRDRNDNAVIVCSIENLDPMGVHTGDSITVAPIQTLSDREYQEMRDDGIKVLRAIGVETGGSNVQFAVDPATGRRLVIEMNPRVSRSSALASKATGFPIAKIAALLAVGYTLDEIPNDITGATPASFEPALDYVVVKVPRFDFAKFPSAPDRLGTSMRSVGEAMAIGRTFPEALQKALRSLENGRSGLNGDPGESSMSVPLRSGTLERRRGSHSPPHLRGGRSAAERIRCRTRWRPTSLIDPWFVEQMSEIVDCRKRPRRAADSRSNHCEAPSGSGSPIDSSPTCGDSSEEEVRKQRLEAGHRTTFKTVDTCAAEFEAHTPYMYGTFEDEDEVPPATKPRVVVLGSGPNRIGQGIEFDYCCVHASFALQRRRLRDRHGQLQPGDRIDRLRHFRSPLFRTVDDRRRDGDRRRRATGGRHRPAGRADPAEPRQGTRAAGRADCRDLARHRSRRPKTASSSRHCAGGSGSSCRRTEPPTPPSTPGRWSTGSAFPSSSGPRSCSGAARCASSTATTSSPNI